ncbi:MAG TPA: AI-2E family transporter YdiK [Burkholderiales bacterium]|nr:AI-2E family transporter YdiK [Burkholderiales bacterium]
MTNKPIASDLARNTLGVLSLGLLIAASLWILWPFLGATIWAGMVVVATWPIMIGLQKRLGGRRWLAVAIMTLAILLLLIVPLTLAIMTVADYRDEIALKIESAKTAKLPEPPHWVGQLPFVGSKAAEEWRELAATAPDDLVDRTTPYVRTVLAWFASQAGTFGLMFLHFLLMVAITASLYMIGENAAMNMRRFGRRLAGERGETSIILSGQAIRAVALGVVVTAIVQTTVAGIGLAICGIPFAAVLTAIIFLLCIAQLGPTLIMAPAVVWLYWSGDPVWGTVLLVWAVIVGSLDNILRPLLIRRGADLPLPLILAGVIGGLIGFGIIGLFVGPVILAVSYRLLQSWVAEVDNMEVDSVG